MAQQSLTASQIITTFELFVSDVTELSSIEELALLNRVYLKVCTDRPYEFLKTQATGTVLTDSTGYYITPPADFSYFVANNSFTDNSIGVHNNAVPRVIFIIANSAYVPYQVINFSDRRQYYNRSGFVYYDTASNIIRFTGTPVGTSYEFDYIKIPALLTITDSPIFPGRFHEMLAFAMATDNSILQLDDKAKSYAQENNVKFASMKLDMDYWNSMLQNN